MPPAHIEERITSWGFPAYRARQVRQWLYRGGPTTIDEWRNVPRALRERLGEELSLGARPPESVVESSDGTRKYLFPAGTSRAVEAAVIPDGHRTTLCLSSQVGCARGCRFCRTGMQGLHGNLDAADIINQFHSLPERETITNIVFMGMGEPLDNLRNVLAAIDTLTAQDAYGLGKRRITLSTIGIHRALATFLDRSEVHLAISVHSPFSEERANLVPAETGNPLQETVDLLRGRREDRRRRITFEYTLLKGVNDTERHARELVRIAGGLSIRVNLIAYHAVPGAPFAATPPERIVTFQQSLVAAGLKAFVRQSRGEDISAACGMLATSYESTERGRESR